MQEWHGLDAGVSDAYSISLQGLFGILNSSWSKLIDLLRSLSPRIELLREKNRMPDALERLKSGTLKKICIVT